jgi:hypothetical protein
MEETGEGWQQALLFVRARMRVAWLGGSIEEAKLAISGGEPWSEHEARRRKEFNG